jgi:redox-sensitive bicupin YhaK (pirin superfamily)
MTAGSGLQHSEMFTLINDDKVNTGELFQIWLNLPKVNKLVNPHFKMLWAEDIPVHTVIDESGNQTEVKIIAGEIGGIKALEPAPDSWAADEKNEVAIWMVKMTPDAKWKMPSASKNAFRVVYFYKGDSVTVDSQEIGEYQAFQLVPDFETEIIAGATECFFLILQGIPIDEPVFQHGPFVMNSKAEIMKAFVDFDETQFGGWPWERRDMVHPKHKGRFARHIDGTEENRP